MLAEILKRKEKIQMRSSQRTQLVIFDVDGVLINKVPTCYPASIFAEFVKKGQNFPKGLMINFAGTNWISELEKIGVDAGKRATLEAISKKMFNFHQDQLRPYKWVYQMIPKLAETKKLAILTNNSLVTVMSCLGGLEKYFAVIKTWENVPKLKPSPLGILAICQELKIIPSRVLMVGDSIEDFAAARDAGTMYSMVKEGNFPVWLE
jgi:phosphoglycolate phosphatase